MENKDSGIATENNGLDRRDFLKYVGGGLVVFFSIDSQLPALQGPPQAKPGGGFGGFGAAPSDLNGYLRIGEDGKITCYSGKIEMGQGNTTALAQMAAEELDVPLESVTMIMGDTDLCPWDMGTFGSMSIRNYGPALRTAAAEAKAILLTMAAEQLSVPKEKLKVEKGVIYSTENKTVKVSYAQLTKGQKITRKLDQKAIQKAVSEFALIGKSPIRVDAIAKATGQAKFAGDLRFPGLLYAKVLRPPTYGAALKSVDVSQAEKFPGAIVVNDSGLVAVLHKDPESAEKARALIKAEFEPPAKSEPDENTIFEYLLKNAPKPQVSPREKKGDIEAGEKAAAKVFEQQYFDGYGAHGSIETHTTIAKLDGDKMTLWASTQTPFPAQTQVAQAIGLQPQNVRVITPYVGGGFGGKSSGQQTTEAARLAKITGKPVQVSFTREEEFFYDAYRPAAIVRIKSGVDAAGKICLWDYHVYFAGDRAAEQFYDVPNNQLSSYGGVMSFGPAPAVHQFGFGAWRAPGANLNVFARESHIDMMAASLKIDPLEFRLKNTSDPRMRGVLEAAAKRFNYKPAPAPSRRGIGMACGLDAETYIAEIAEITVDKNNKIKVKKVVAAQDMGVAINPEGALMQIEGCVMMGLGYALAEDIRFNGSKIHTKNFDEYDMPKFSWLPEIDAILVKNEGIGSKGGGEPGIVPVGGAIANALFDLTGVRVFQMPLTPARIQKAMSQKSGA